MAKHRRLDREQVVAQAAALADDLGSVQQVTLTALAASLDIRVPSLYNHISSLDDLHEALANYALQELVVLVRRATAGKVGQEALVAMAWAYRHFAQVHPGLYPLTLAAPAPDDALRVALAQELLQILLLIFASVRIQGDDAIHAVRGLRALLHGFAMLEAAEGFKMAYDLEESFRFVLMAYLAGLPSTIKAWQETV
jgi:AcrR family transcriptional regulator